MDYSYNREWTVKRSNDSLLFEFFSCINKLFPSNMPNIEISDWINTLSLCVAHLMVSVSVTMLFLITSPS